ncbi:unnamed protein product [Rotaria sp. Silwood1]|nr:unnamed protein product [Rotaria sp. Silwood1]
MSPEHIHRLSTSSTSSISSMSIDDIQISSTSPASSTSTSSNTNVSSSSSNSLSYSSERICYLLKHEKPQYDIVENNRSSPVGSYWAIFGFIFSFNSSSYPGSYVVFVIMLKYLSIM